MANSVDPDQMPHSVASDPGLHSLQDLFVPILRVITVSATSFYFKMNCLPLPISTVYHFS